MIGGQLWLLQQCHASSYSGLRITGKRKSSSVCLLEEMKCFETPQPEEDENQEKDSSLRRKSGTKVQKQSRLGF